MMELIDRAKVLAKIYEFQSKFNETGDSHERVAYASAEHCMLVIKASPAVEAEPVRHGHWIAVSAFDACGGDEEAWMAHGNPIAYHYCSECKNETYLNEEGKEILSDYCPFCGADMWEVIEDVGTD